MGKGEGPGLDGRVGDKFVWIERVK